MAHGPGLVFTPRARSCREFALILPFETAVGSELILKARGQVVD